MAEKTEEPTPQKLREARKKGNVAFSRDLSSMAVFAAGVPLIFLVATATARVFTISWQRVCSVLGRDDILLDFASEALPEVVTTVLWTLAPLLGGVVAVGLLAGFGQVGFNIATEPLKPKLSKLDPLSRVKQWFGAQGLVELVKSAVKLAAVFGLGYLAVRSDLPAILRLGLNGPEALIATASDVLRPFLMSVALVFAVLGLADLLFQRRQWRKKLRMSKDEVKREFKTSEGDPEIKGQRKQVHMEMLHDVGRAVSKSAAVVVNPTHLAVAIEYERGGSTAPRVAAKGRLRVAEKIRTLARKHRVPVVRNVPLARALIEVDVAAAVPEELYDAVAEILLFAWKVKEAEGR